MEILVIGGGGREHAISVCLKKSQKVTKLYCIPGNAGIAEIAECVNIGVMEFNKIADFIDNHSGIEMTVVAPDDPLSGGLVDYLEERGHRAFGPSKAASLIESSKAFSKSLMKKYNIATADFNEFSDYNLAEQYINSAVYPLVVKADGLALGKGVIICNNILDGRQAIKSIMLDGKFSSAGKIIIVEEFLVGREVTVLCFTDGTTVYPMVSSQDHKRAYDDDIGLNTGGMGTFSPSLIYTEKMVGEVYDNIILPTIAAMNAENRKFKGVLYFGLMITDNGIKVIEYNARFGDPEAQVVLPRLETDLVEIFNAVIDENLSNIDIKWSNDACVCVVLASGGYPEEYDKNIPITIGSIDNDITLYHAGTDRCNGQLVTNGGRVIGVTAMGNCIEEARAKAYKNIDKIYFKKMHFRKDIGIKL